MLTRQEEIELHNIYALADNKFYAPLKQLSIDSRFVKLAYKNLPSGWKVDIGGFWITINPPYEIETREWIHEGTKLHLSTRPEFIEVVIKEIFSILYEGLVPFKFVADEFRFYWQNSKAYNRFQSGKFLTVYPANGNHFRILAERLAQRALDLAITGPAILSDTCFRTGTPVYYRYGAFIPRQVIGNDGRTETLVKGVDGGFEADTRTLSGLSKALKPSEKKAWLERVKQRVIIGNRYRVESALSYSNTGGVYLCLDTRYDQKVVVKEARRHTNFWSIDGLIRDATDILKHEARVLRALDGLSAIPRLIDFIYDGGHAFLIMEYKPGISLASFPADERFIVSTHLHELETAFGRISRILEVAAMTIDSVLKVHERGIVLADISPNNVLYDPDNGQIALIDFESALLPKDNYHNTSRAAYWGTTGFRRRSREKSRSIGFSDDWFSLSRLLLHLIVPITPSLNLSTDLEERFWLFLCAQGISKGVHKAAINLQSGFPHSALRQLHFAANCNEIKHHDNKRQLSDRTLRYMVSGIEKSMTQRLDTTADGPILPSHCLVYETNPLSLEYGACGPLLFMRKAYGSFPAQALDWLNSQCNRSPVLPPGFCLGWAGIAYTYAHLGEVKASLSCLKQAAASLQHINDPYLRYGVAGIGLAAIRIDKLLPNDEATGIAHQAMQVLTDKLSWRSGMPSWLPPEAVSESLGFAEGRAGIALFLMEYGATYSEPRAIALSQSTLNSDLMAAVQTDKGPAWPRREGDTMLLPYFFTGSAGIASVCLRAHQIIGSQQYLQESIKIANSCFSVHTFNPGLVSGLAGIGELFLDLYRHTGDTSYFERAREVAEGVCLFAIEDEEGISFPGRWLSRISHDFSTGSAGIGIFLRRLLTMEPRLILEC